MQTSHHGRATHRGQWLTLVCGLVAVLVSAPRVQAARGDGASVTIRVDDYAAVAADLLARAQDEVSQLYAAIGVDTTWLKDGSTPDVTVIVLSASMTTRMAPPEHAMGVAATSEA